MYRQPDEITGISIEGYDNFDAEMLDDLDISILPGKQQNQLSIIAEGKNYQVTIRSYDDQVGEYKIRINGIDFNCRVVTRLGQLIQELGFNKMSKIHDMEILAPMPGLVLHTAVSDGDMISEGDTLLTLEAMKMENIIKAHFDGKISKVHVQKGDKVEKGQLIISFEEPDEGE